MHAQHRVTAPSVESVCHNHKCQEFNVLTDQITESCFAFCSISQCDGRFLEGCEKTKGAFNNLHRRGMLLLVTFDRKSH